MICLRAKFQKMSGCLGCIIFKRGESERERERVFTELRSTYIIYSIYLLYAVEREGTRERERERERGRERERERGGERERGSESERDRARKIHRDCGAERVTSTKRGELEL